MAWTVPCSQARWCVTHDPVRAGRRRWSEILAWTEKVTLDGQREPLEQGGADNSRLSHTGASGMCPNRPRPALFGYFNLDVRVRFHQAKTALMFSYIASRDERETAAPNGSRFSPGVTTDKRWVE